MGKTAGGNPLRLHRARREDLHLRQRRLSQEVPGGAGEVPGRAARSPPGIAERRDTRAASSSSARSQPSAAPPRLDALTSYVESFSQIQKRPQGEATITTRTMWSFPDRVRQERTMALAGQDDVVGDDSGAARACGSSAVGSGLSDAPGQPAQPRAGLRTASGRVASRTTVSRRSRPSPSARRQSTASASRGPRRQRRD